MQAGWIFTDEAAEAIRAERETVTATLAAIQAGRGTERAARTTPDLEAMLDSGERLMHQCRTVWPSLAAAVEASIAPIWQELARRADGGVA